MFAIAASDPGPSLPVDISVSNSSCKLGMGQILAFPISKTKLGNSAREETVEGQERMEIETNWIPDWSRNPLSLPQILTS